MYFFVIRVLHGKKGLVKIQTVLIRDMLYKVDDFRTLNQYAISRIAKQLNERPRQTLGYKTPKQALAELR